jgi:hypothetical protein
MSTTPEYPPTSKKMVWAGYIVSALPALALAISGIMKFMPPNEQATEGFKHLGWPLDSARNLGVLELICTALYVFPRTAVIGAILLTGYLGGAISTHVRVGDQFIIQSMLGVLVWLGLWLRDPRIRALIPWRS